MPRWTNDTLQPFRALGDPLADAVIADIFSDGGVDAMNALMRSFVANEHIVPEGLHPAVRSYLEQTAELPAWADPDKIALGERIFWRFGAQQILVLVCYSLPFCYLGQNGVPVLAMTNRLGSNSQRRIVETAQMVVDVMQSGGLTTAGGRGRLTIQKVRLMHATIRRLVQADPSWRQERGLPINQEDLAGTMLAFSWISLDGLAKLGIPLEPAELEAYIHCWNVVGHMLGLHDELLPASAADAKALAAAIATHEFGPTPQGKALTTALVDMLGTSLVGTAFEHVSKVMIRYFLGREWAGWLGLDEGFFSALIDEPIHLLGLEVGRTIEDSDAAHRIAEELGHTLIEAVMVVERGGNRPSFTIPTELRLQWGVNWTS